MTSLIETRLLGRHRQPRPSLQLGSMTEDRAVLDVEIAHVVGLEELVRGQLEQLASGVERGRPDLEAGAEERRAGQRTAAPRAGVGVAALDLDHVDGDAESLGGDLRLGRVGAGALPSDGAVDLGAAVLHDAHDGVRLSLHLLAAEVDAGADADGAALGAVHGVGLAPAHELVLPAERLGALAQDLLAATRGEMEELGQPVEVALRCRGAVLADERPPLLLVCRA